MFENRLTTLNRYLNDNMGDQKDILTEEGLWLPHCPYWSLVANSSLVPSVSSHRSRHRSQPGRPLISIICLILAPLAGHFIRTYQGKYRCCSVPGQHSALMKPGVEEPYSDSSTLHRPVDYGSLPGLTWEQSIYEGILLCVITEMVYLRERVGFHSWTVNIRRE